LTNSYAAVTGEENVKWVSPADETGEGITALRVASTWESLPPCHHHGRPVKITGLVFPVAEPSPWADVAQFDLFAIM